MREVNSPVWEQCKNNFNRRGIIDIVRRPDAWAPILDRVLETFLESQEGFIRIYEKALKMPCEASLNVIDVGDISLGGVITYDFGTQAVPLFRRDYLSNSEQDRVVEQIPVVNIDASRRNKYIGISGPTSLDPGFLNNGILSVDPEGKVISTGIPSFKGGIIIKQDLSLELATAEQLTETYFDRETNIAALGASLTLDTNFLHELQPGEADLLLLARSICIENKYLDSYNDQFGFLSQSKKGDMLYHVVSYSPRRGDEVHAANPTSHFPDPIGESVVWGTYLLLRHLETYKEPRTAVLLEEFIRGVPFVVSRHRRQTAPVEFLFPVQAK